MQPFVLHAHFYQPERLNPWTGALDPEPSAAPDRDWNHRILRECYRPNGAARIFDEQRRVERIVNNYEYLSFNFGPTLLSWMEEASPAAYAKVLDGDWRSAVRLGHGNALAQAYNHMILPLGNERDVRTQIRWGQADFRSRFAREAEGMWLPETACNPATVDALIDAGIRFTVLAPYQAARVRYAGGDWQAAEGNLDLGRAYRSAHSDGSGRTLAIFFYDGGLAQGLAFDPATVDAAVLVERIQASVPPSGGLVSVALDGETFGHHHAFGELGLAYALHEGAPSRSMQPTNYAAWLAANPPVDDVEVVGGEGTAWSCSHGVGRWYRDCGCSTDALPGWDQAWRTPLREALDIVRETAVDAFTGLGAELLRDPWAARDEYIEVRLGNLAPKAFLERHARRSVDDRRAVDLWSLLEAQRHAMVMYTSCGWFFADISGIETVYVLRSARRVLDLLGEVGVKTRTGDVLARLATATSNKPGVGNGADVWRDQVEAAVVGPTRVAAHSALAGFVGPLPEQRTTGGHLVTVVDSHSENRGRVGLATAHLQVSSKVTGRWNDYAVTAVHLGGLDFHGVVAPYPGDAEYRGAMDELWHAFPTAPVPRLLRMAGSVFEGEEFDLSAALPEGRQDIVGSVFSDLAERFDEQYARLYTDHQRVLEMLGAAGYELPRNLRAAAELTLSTRLEQQLAAAVGEGSGPETFAAITKTITLARSQGYQLDLAPVEEAVTDAVTEASATAADRLAGADVERVRRWLALSGELGVDIDLSHAQERVYEVAVQARAGRLAPDAVDQVAALGTLVGLSPVTWAVAR